MTIDPYLFRCERHFNVPGVRKRKVLYAKRTSTVLGVKNAPTCLAAP